MFKTSKMSKNGFAFLIIMVVILLLTLIISLLFFLYAGGKIYFADKMLKEAGAKTAYASSDDTGYFNSGYMFDNSAATADELNKYFKEHNTPFDKDKLGEDLGKAIVDTANKYHLNPVYIAAHALHETGATSLSAIAKDKKNIFGFMAYDRDPYTNAKAFSSYAEGVDVVMGYVKAQYLTPKGNGTGAYYEGETLEAMNKHYATGQGWAQGIKTKMLEIYRDIGKAPPNLTAK